MRVAFAGTPEFALPALAALIARHEVVGVLTQPDRPAGRGKKLKVSPVKAAALAAHLPLVQPQSLTTEAGRADLTAWNPQLLVVVAYGLILPVEVLRAPSLGCVNIHASLLPRWRGAAPVQRAILAGDTESGVSIMQMDAGLDTGPVLLQRRCAISPQHTGGVLHDELSVLGAEALIAALDGLEQGSLTGVPQPREGATYAAKIGKAESRIEWRRDALGIERQVRAFNPWPVAQTTLDGETLRIFAARAQSATNEAVKVAKSDDPGLIISVQGDSMQVVCGTGTLSISQVQRPGRRPVGVRDFSHTRQLLGHRLG
ncbi:MAG: methionyl-tRNA formyltransferase [Steroidobacteraceae bacterium]